MSELVLVVTGGRGYGVSKRGEPIARRREAENERATLVMTLNALKPVLVIAGGATGADAAAVAWCRSNGVDYIEHLPNLAKYGSPAAYHVRNREMVDSVKLYRSKTREVAVVAFPGGTGTAGTVEYAKSKRVRIIRPGDVQCGELVEARAEVVVGQSSLPL